MKQRDTDRRHPDGERGAAEAEQAEVREAEARRDPTDGARPDIQLVEVEVVAPVGPLPGEEDAAAIERGFQDMQVRTTTGPSFWW